jgi:hypothetical protein
MDSLRGVEELELDTRDVLAETVLRRFAAARREQDQEDR